LLIGKGNRNRERKQQEATDTLNHDS